MQAGEAEADAAGGVLIGTVEPHSGVLPDGGFVVVGVLVPPPPVVARAEEGNGEAHRPSQLTERVLSAISIPPVKNQFVHEINSTGNSIHLLGPSLKNTISILPEELLPTSPQ